jgi:biopolymer transport protein ExbB
LLSNIRFAINQHLLLLRFQKNQKRINMKNVKTAFAAIVIPVALIISIIIYKFVLGAPTNFIEGNPDGEPIKFGVGGYLGTIYKGGVIVPILITMLLVVITFTIERFLTINASKGKGSVDAFVNKVRTLLSQNDFQGVVNEATDNRVLLPMW